MIVRLTRHQFKNLRGMIDRSASFWWDSDLTQDASAHRVDVTMPAIGWRQLEQMLFEHCYDERGFKRRKVRSTFFAADRAIRTALNAREQHPALFGSAAVGRVSEFVPAWKFPGPDVTGKRYSPYPVQSMPFVVLAPMDLSLNGKRATKWVECPNPPGWEILDSCKHLDFTR